jgi:hypothetical protein
MAITQLESSTLSNVTSATFTTFSTDHKLHLFKFWEISPATDAVNFTVQFNVTGQSGFNETLTTTYMRSYNNEANNSNAMEFDNTLQQPGEITQNYGVLADSLSNTSEKSLAGEMYLYDAAGTVFRPDYHAHCVYGHSSTRAQTTWTSGMINQSPAIIAVDFKMSSGNMDGIITLYGIGAEV